MDPIPAIFLTALLLAGNAFFVGAEFSLVSARRSALDRLAADGSKAAARATKAMSRLSHMLAGAQLGITMCSLGLGALGEPLIAHALETPFHLLHIEGAWVTVTSFTLALAVMTYLHVVLGEMVPKNLALTNPDRAAMILARPLLFIVKLLNPAVAGLNAIANGLLRSARVTPQEEVTSAFTSDEVAGFVEESQREGLLSDDEGSLLAGALKFDEFTVRAVTIKITDLVTISKQATPEDIEQLAARTGFSRFPVMNRRGRLEGYVHLKDVIGASAEESGKPLDPKRYRPLKSISIQSSLHEALAIMQRDGSHLAIVLDRRKTAAGIIALEDVLEQLVGEISSYQPARSAPRA